MMCPHCNVHSLLSEHELYVKCCYVCRRYGLLLGRWPNSEGMTMVSIKLTDAQIARVLELCKKIGQIQNEVPAPPVGVGMAETASLEVAKSIRASLERENSALLELGALLRPEMDPIAHATNA